MARREGSIIKVGVGRYKVELELDELTPSSSNWNGSLNADYSLLDAHNVTNRNPTRKHPSGNLCQDHCEKKPGSPCVHLHHRPWPSSIRQNRFLLFEESASVCRLTRRGKSTDSLPVRFGEQVINCCGAFACNMSKTVFVAGLILHGHQAKYPG